MDLDTESKSFVVEGQEILDRFNYMNQKLLLSTVENKNYEV